MSYTILEITNPARLSVRDSQLVIERDGLLPFFTPVCDINTLLLAHPQVTLTQAVISHLAEAGAAVVTIDRQYRPTAMTLPLQANSLQAERIALQAQMTPVQQKRLWTQIVRAKIRAQGKLLQEMHGSHGGLVPMAQRVRSGDPENMEAQAARRYWSLLFPGTGFRRGAEQIAGSMDQNRFLDYGYTVLRATVARAICAAGLHPSIGIHHHNRYDSFSLASDLMEPFRPVIDRRVCLWIENHNSDSPVDSAVKKWLIEATTMRYWLYGEQRTLSDIAQRTAISLAEVLAGRSEELDMPEGLEPCPDESTSPPTDVCG